MHAVTFSSLVCPFLTRFFLNCLLLLLLPLSPQLLVSIIIWAGMMMMVLMLMSSYLAVKVEKVHLFSIY